MSYKEKILISLEADNQSVEAFNSQMELVEKKAKELGITIDKSMGAIFSKFSSGVSLNVDTKLARKELSEINTQMETLSNNGISIKINTSLAEEEVLTLQNSIAKLEDKKIKLGIEDSGLVQGLVTIDNSLDNIIKKTNILKEDLNSLAIKSEINLTANVDRVKIKEQLTGDQYVKLKVLVTTEQVKVLHSNISSTLETLKPLYLNLGYTKQSLNELVRSLKEDLAVKDLPINFTIANVSEIIQDFNTIKTEIASKVISLKFGVRGFSDTRKNLIAFRKELLAVARTEQDPWVINIKGVNTGELDTGLTSLKGILKDITETSIKVSMGEGITTVKANLGYINSQLTKFKQKQFIKLGIDKTSLNVIKEKLTEIRAIFDKTIKVTFSVKGLRAVKARIEPLLQSIRSAKEVLAEPFNAESFTVISGNIDNIIKLLPLATKELNSFNKSLKDVPKKVFTKLFQSLERMDKLIDKLTEKASLFKDIWQAPMADSALGDIPNQLKTMESELKNVKKILQSLGSMAKTPIIPTISINPQVTETVNTIENEVEDLRLSLTEIDTMTITPHLESRSIISASANMVKFQHRAEELRVELMNVQQEMLELGHITELEASEMARKIQGMTAEEVMFGETARKSMNAFGMSIDNVAGLFTKITGTGASAGQQLSEVFGGAKAFVLRNELEASNNYLRQMGASAEVVDANMKKIKNTTNEELLALDLVANGIKSIDLTELFGTKKFKSLAPSFLTGNVNSQLELIKAELRSYNMAMLKTGNITEKVYRKMGKEVDTLTATNIKDMKKMKGAMTSLGESTSAVRGLFVQLTRVFIASMYLKQISQYLDTINKVKTAVLSFETNPAYDQLAGQMDRIQDVTGGALTKLALMPAVNKALALGVDMSNGKLLKLAEMTTKMSQAFGTDAVQAFNDFTTAISKGSAIVLDNIGVLLRQEEAQKLEYKALGITTKSFNKWRSSLSQAAKRAIYMKWGIVRLTEKTNKLTLVTTEYTQAVGGLKEQWDNFGQTLSGSNGFSIATAAVQRLTDVLYVLQNVIELTNSSLQSLGMAEDYKGLQSISKLTEEVQMLGDGAWQANEIMRFFRTNLRELTISANNAKKAMEGLSNTVAVTTKVQQDIFNNKQWVKDLNEMVGTVELLNGNLDSMFNTMIQGNADINIVRRTLDGYIASLGKTGDIFDKLSDKSGRFTRVFGNQLKDGVKELYVYYNTLKDIGANTTLSEQLKNRKSIMSVASTIGDVSLMLLKGGVAIKTLAVAESEGLGALSKQMLTNTMHSKALNKEFLKLSLTATNLRMSLAKFTLGNRNSFTERIIEMGKNLGIAKDKMLSLIKAHQKYAIAMIKSGKVPEVFTQFLVKRLKDTNKEVGKLAKSLQSLYDQWIKLKRKSEQGLMNPFDKKAALITNRYMDSLKQIKDLYSKIGGHKWDALFPDFQRGKKDITSYYNAFNNIKADMENLSNQDFSVKYTLTVNEMKTVLQNFGDTGALAYKKLLDAQNKYLESVKSNLINSRIESTQASFDKFYNTLDNLDKRFSKVGNYVNKAGIFDFSSEYALAEKMTESHYRVLLTKASDYYQNVIKLRRDNELSSLSRELKDKKQELEDNYSAEYKNTLRILDAKKVAHQRLTNLERIEYSKAIKAEDEMNAKKLLIDETYENKKRAIILKSVQEISDITKKMNEDHSADTKRLLEISKSQYQAYADEVNKTMMQTGEFRFNRKILNFSPDDLGFQGLKDFFTLGTQYADELKASFRNLIPEEYKAVIDIDSSGLKIIPEEFKNLGTETQQQILDMIRKLNPAFRKISSTMQKPADIFKDTMLDALKEIGKALGEFTAKMMWERTDAFNQYNQTRKESMEALDEDRNNGLITQAEYEAKSASISQKFNEDKANYEKKAKKETLLGLAQTFWAQGIGLGIKGLVDVATPGKQAQGTAEIGGGIALGALASLLGYMGASIQTSSASSQASQAKDRGQRDRYVILNNNLFEDELSFSRAVSKATEEY